MVSRVLYRPFDTEDFDAIALILQQLWHNNSDNDEYNRLEAACDLAYCLSSSTFSQVAVIDSQARGISLARAGQSSGATINEHWMDTERALLSQMRELEPDACAEYLSFVRATIRTNNRLLESSRCRTTTRSRCLPLIAMSTDWALARFCSMPRSRTCPHAGRRGRTCTPTPTARGSSTSCTALNAWPRTAPTAKSAATPCHAKASSTNST